jgi:hypothetical protein
MYLSILAKGWRHGITDVKLVSCVFKALLKLDDVYSAYADENEAHSVKIAYYLI